MSTELGSIRCCTQRSVRTTSKKIQTSATGGAIMGGEKVTQTEQLVQQTAGGKGRRPHELKSGLFN